MYLGIDTSNYSTSAALMGDTGYFSVTRLLPVKSGEAGLRQSDAVFHHTKQLPEIMRELFEKAGETDITAIGVSTRPRPQEGSYMPCFLCGEGLADSIAAAYRIPVYKTSHQTGHILAALYSADRSDMLNSPFIAFHVSGGTTECLYCTPSDTDIINITEAAVSLDLKAGQLIDRTGLMLGLDFPCGIALEQLAAECTDEIKVRIPAKDGNVSLSGFENKAQKLINEGAPAPYVARFILTAVYEAVRHMTISVRSRFGRLPVIYAGGVMSDIFIQEKLASVLDDISFSRPELSRDNAVGTAIYAMMTDRRKAAG